MQSWINLIRKLLCCTIPLVIESASYNNVRDTWSQLLAILLQFENKKNPKYLLLIAVPYVAWSNCHERPAGHPWVKNATSRVWHPQSLLPLITRLQYSCRTWKCKNERTCALDIYIKHIHFFFLHLHLTPPVNIVTFITLAKGTNARSYASIRLPCD